MVSNAPRSWIDGSGELGLLRELLVSLPAGVAYVSGPDLVFQFANQEYRRMVGGRELIGLSLREALPELAQERLEAVGWAARTGQRLQGCESEVWIRRHGEEAEQLFVDFTYQPVRDDAGGVAGVLLYGSDVTQHVRDRRELERRTAQLSESQERYRTLFETMPQGVVHYSADGSIIGVNPAASEILGMDLAGVTSWPVVPRGQAVREDGSPFPPEDLPVPVALRTGEIVDGVVAGIRHGRTGELRWVRVTAVPDARDEHGRPRRAYAIFTDLTGQRQTEAALQQSTALLGRLREANVLGVAVVGEQRVYEANDAYLDIIGYSRDDLEAGRIAWRKITPRKWAAAENKALEQLRRTGACQPFEKEHIHKDGHPVPVLIGAAVIDRNPMRWVSFVVELTARQRAEQERAGLLAREQAARMEADAAQERLAFLLGAGDLVAATGSRRELLDQVAQLVVPALSDYCVIFLPTAEGMLRAASVVHQDPARTAILEGLRKIDIPPGGPLIVQVAFTEATTQLVPDVSARMPGWTREAWEVTDILKRVHPDSAIAMPLLAGQRRLGVAVLGRGDGRPRFTETDMAVITELSRRLSAGLANVETSQRLREVNMELSHVTEVLREQQQAKDQFIATLSHELRNPLAAIRAAVDLLTLDSPAGHPAIGVLDRQVGALGRMTDDLLDASRALTGRLTVIREPLDLRGVVQAVTGDLRADFDRTQRALIVTVPEDAVVVEGDQVRLAQLLGNLLSNALAYTRPGATITAQLTSQPGTVAGEPGYANLVVRDDGIGFEPDQAEMLFEVFARAVPARSADEGFGEGAAPGGLGLGLGLVRSIAELHGGTASAYSQGPGKGAEFTVRLPLRTPVLLGAGPPVPVHAPLSGGSAGSPAQPTANPAHPPRSHGQAPAGRRHPPDRARLHVLVIEDNADLAMCYQRLLQRRGDQVAIAVTGEEGLSAAHMEPFDLILCDIGLPDIDGRDIARQLRAHPCRRHMRLVAVSGFTQEVDRQRSLEAGFDAHLAKPMTLADLDDALSGWSPDQAASRHADRDRGKRRR